MTARIVLVATLAVSLLSPAVDPVGGALLGQAGFGPGQRVLLDAHNAYPQNDRWRDRIDRALSTGLPVAIEQDLFWKKDGEQQFRIVVAHDTSELDRAPTLDAYFFQRIRPIMERALAEQRRDTWPLIVLNLDFKQNDAALLDAVYTLLGKYESWLTTAPRTSTPEVAAPLTVRPLLVLSGSNEAQRARFHDAVPVGERLRAFGAIPPAVVPGANDDERDANMSRLPAEQIIAPKASNYARWVNFPWLVVEPEGQTKAGDWSAIDQARLKALVTRAHAQNLWIRFYTLDGFLNGDGDGLTRSYDFGSDAAVKLRWRAAIEAGVDFIATDHYERFNAARREP
jgi:glycerophosphoryl diester phosphodiesterase